MNIFFLHWIPHISAQYHFNAHVIKIILEITQMLCTAYHECGYTDESLPFKLYKSTHKNHPTSKWIRDYTGNFVYACKIGLALCHEYTFRYGKIHKCQPMIEYFLNHPINTQQGDKFLLLPSGDVITPPALAMPPEYKVGNAIDSYRAYYQSSLKAKLAINGWKKREKPSWFNTLINL